jgi:hypothetical protein
VAAPSSSADFSLSDAYPCEPMRRLMVLVAVAVSIGALSPAEPAGATAGTVAWFHSPSGNIECEVASGDPRGTYADCQTFRPAQTATLKRDGHTSVCSRRACPIGNGPTNATTLD